MTKEVILEATNLQKSFGGVKAVNNVSFRLNRGDVLGIIGPNGSGKTTLINLLTGFVKKDGGQVLFRGHDISHWPAHKIADLGVTRTFQIMRPYPTLAAYKNLIPPLYSPRARRMRRGDLGDRETMALDIMDKVGFERDARVPYKLAGTLPQGYLKRLELCRCLALNPEIIICDEIFSGLSMSEIASMIPLLEKLLAEGLTLIMVEHRLRELFRLAGWVMVLNFGEKIAEGKPTEVISKENVKMAYFGGDESHVFLS